MGIGSSQRRFCKNYIHGLQYNGKSERWINKTERKWKMNHPKVCKTSANGYIKVTEGIFRKTLVFGKNSLLAEFQLEKGKQLPLHKHPQEQVGYLVSGHIILHIDCDNYDILPGDSWAILGDIEHSAEIIEESIAIEIFSPLREDYLP